MQFALRRMGMRFERAAGIDAHEKLAQRAAGHVAIYQRFERNPRILRMRNPGGGRRVFQVFNQRQAVHRCLQWVKGDASIPLRQAGVLNDLAVLLRNITLLDHRIALELTGHSRRI